MFNPHKPILDQSQIISTDASRITVWTATKLKVFEACQWQAFLRYVQKLAEAKSEAADRGSKIHELAEQYVKGEIGELPKDLQRMPNELAWARNMYEEGLVEVEGEWGFGIGWEKAPWTGKQTWGRAKLDLFIRFDDTSAMIVDHKTGKKFGNEMAHTFQGMVYALVAFMRFPELEYIAVEFWYLDKNEKLVMAFTRAEAMVFLPKVHDRALKMTSATYFRPSPSPSNCRFCPYKDEGCDWSVT